MSYILYHGCSFTKNDYVSFDTSIQDKIKSWPHWASKKLGEEFICLAECGRPNSIIINQTIDHVLENYKKISCVAVSLSGWDRIHVIDERFSLIPAHHKSIKLFYKLYKEGRNQAVMDHVHNRWGYFKVYFDYMDKEINNEEKSWRNTLKDIILDELIVDERSIQNILNDTLRLVVNLVNVCNSVNIPLLVSQGPGPLPFLSDQISKILDEKDLVHLAPFTRPKSFFDTLVIQSPLFKHLNKVKNESSKQIFLGWPLIDELGGKCMTTYFRDFLKKGIIDDIMESKVSDADAHPSELAHKLYGENIIAPQLIKLLDN